MKPRKKDVMAAVLFVSIVALATGAPQPVPCEPDGKNWATILEGCQKNQALHNCSDYDGSADPGACPGLVYVKRYSGNFLCYSSDAIGGQTTTCVAATGPDGSAWTSNCLDSQKCERQNKGSFPTTYWCVPIPGITTTQSPVWTNVGCVPGQQ